MSATDTVVACLTPPGAGAIAVLTVVGPEAWEIARPLFQPRSGSLPTELTELKPGTFRLGHFGVDVSDEVVLVVKQLEPYPRVEIHCHGGREVVRMLCELLEQRGAQVVSWQALTYQTSSSPIEAEAAIALAHACTERTAAILLDQYHGALKGALLEVAEALSAGDPELALQRLRRPEKWSQLGSHLTEPFRIVIAGPPNVGKSSLINALAGFQRSVVSETPGTTRDVVRATLALDGWLVDLADTAGLREDADFLEAQGIDLARTIRKEADLCLWLMSAAEEPIHPSEIHPNTRIVINKMDLPQAWDIHKVKNAWHISAKTGEGIPEMIDHISSGLVPCMPEPGEAVPFTVKLVEKIREIRQLTETNRIPEAQQQLQALLIPHLL